MFISSVKSLTFLWICSLTKCVYSFYVFDLFISNQHTQLLFTISFCHSTNLFLILFIYLNTWSRHWLQFIIDNGILVWGVTFHTKSEQFSRHFWSVLLNYAPGDPSCCKMISNRMHLNRLIKLSAQNCSLSGSDHGVCSLDAEMFDWG